MSVLSHLTNTKNKLVLSGTEKSNIQTSISNLQTRLENYFGNQVRSILFLVRIQEELFCQEKPIQGLTLII
jgi:hypothetical protein